MILESIVTTVDENGVVNIAPLGPIVLPPDPDELLPSFLLRPYQGSKTCENLLANGKAVIHVTDDVLLLAKTAIGHVPADGLVCQAVGGSTHHQRLVDCHRWFAVEVTSYGGTPPRHEMKARCVVDGVQRPFFGFNRAKHAVIEAAILATRIGIIDSQVIRDSIEALRTPVEKTAGLDEAEAFEMIVQFVSERLL
ncbi:DUF447 domain-containing protein [Neorhodopirellula pilleata]|uniref:Uncharacterized protein n=1 Tax=Neorhodopirellula pilleata TaxID=2714738 RepID=A0A5C6A4H4_9BACT|nr:DUF447 domain-containing protein [Neorhodopirellula pilleata]TWT94369.1 hypothetical protein Pla100_39810 [Neorhodopirellula pilleata]